MKYSRLDIRDDLHWQCFIYSRYYVTTSMTFVVGKPVSIVVDNVMSQR